jgi:hypothetical protein
MQLFATLEIFATIIWLFEKLYTSLQNKRQATIKTAVNKQNRLGKLVSPVDGCIGVRK